MERMREQVREHDVFGWHERFWGALIPAPPKATQHRWLGAVEAFRRK